MKKNYKINKRTLVEYLVVALLVYVGKSFVLKSLAEELLLLTKVCAIVGIIILLVALVMLVYEAKTKEDFRTGDPVAQSKFKSDEEFERAKAEMPASYWYGRATLDRQYAIVSVGIIGGLGVGLLAWSHVVFLILYVAIMILAYLTKTVFYEVFDT